MAPSPPAASGRIFISYRREETAYPAGWLFDRLSEEFSPGQIFKDVDSIALGDDFVEVITKAVGSTDVLLALIGHQWLTIKSADGTRRLDSPDDFVRIEIEAALTRKVRVIPILVDGAKMPRAEELPPSLSTLARRQALELSPSQFDFDTSRLLKVLDKTFADVRTAQEVPDARGQREPPMPRTGPRLPRRYVLAGAAVLALAIVGIVLAVVLGGPSPTPGPDVEGTTSTQGVSPKKALTFEWSPALRFGGAGHQEVTALAPTGSGSSIAVGFQTVDDPTTKTVTNEPLAWQRRRGAWRRESLTSPQHYGELQAAAFDRSSSTVVVGGASGIGRAHSAAAVWTKAGSGDWHQVCLGDCSSPAGRSEIWGVLALPEGGFVAVGQGAATSPTDFHPTVWTSDDGLVWEPNVLNKSNVGVVQWIARTADGRLVAVGNTGPEKATSAAVWTSTNGTNWRTVDAPSLAPAKDLHAVAAAGKTLLAVGFEKVKRATPDCGNRRHSALFRSKDGGQTWQRRRSSELEHAEQWFDVVAYSNQFVALGYEFVGCSRNSEAAAWTSPNGTRWTRLRGPFRVPASFFGRGAVSSRSLYAVGAGPSVAATSSGAEDERDATIWAARGTR